MTLERGTLLRNRYRIVEILGEGGMGAVYKAEDENLKVTVAVKENLFTTDEYMRQFEVEATIMASLRHPNLPRVTDQFEIKAEGQYLVMDFIEGEDLRDRMDRLGILDEKEVVVVGMAISEALKHLHTRTPPVLHRDIKPGNVKIAPDGNIFLVDFGLAKIVQGSQMTITGARAMTPGYSPPEQYGTARTDVRSDIYSLGATLYSAVTGSLPEDGLARAMNQVDLTPVRRLNPQVSRKLAGAIEKSLEVQPDDRFQTAEEFGRALRNTQRITRRRTNEMTVPPPPIPDLDLSSRLPVANGLGENKSSDSAPVERNFSDIFSNPYGAEPSSVFDGEDLFDSSPKPKRRRASGIWLVFLALIIVGGSAAVYIFFPGVARQALAFVVSPSNTSTPPVVTDNIVADNPGGTPTLFSAAMTATPRATEIPPTPTATKGPTATEVLPTPTSTEILPTPTEVILPTAIGGSFGQVSFASIQNGVSQIWVIDVDGSNPTQLTDIEGGACQAEWSPDGNQFLFISPCGGEQEDYPESTIFIADSNGANIRPLLEVSRGDYDPAWSPDGQRIAFVSQRGLKPQIYVLNLSDSSVALVAGEGNKNIHPSWSADGSMLVFISLQSGPYQVWTLELEGGEQKRFSRSGGLKDSFPAWSLDGNQIVFTQRDPDSEIPRLIGVPVESDGFQEIKITDVVVPARDADFSPDGFWLVFEGWPDTQHNIYLLNRVNGEVFQLTDDTFFNFDPSWRPAASGN